MTFALNLLIAFSALSLVAGIENVSLVCTFQWAINGAKGKPNCTDQPNTNAPPTGTGVGHTQPQTSQTPPGSVVKTNNPFSPFPGV